MTREEAKARWICCPLCDKRKCEREADDCDVNIHLKNKAESEEKKMVINIPKNATNGEALCMLFPDMHYTLSDKSLRVVTTIGVASSFDIDWWNAPYEAKSEIQCNRTDEEIAETFIEDVEASCIRFLTEGRK